MKHAIYLALGLSGVLLACSGTEPSETPSTEPTGAGGEQAAAAEDTPEPVPVEPAETTTPARAESEVPADLPPAVAVNERPWQPARVPAALARQVQTLLRQRVRGATVRVLGPALPPASGIYATVLYPPEASEDDDPDYADYRGDCERTRLVRVVGGAAGGDGALRVEGEVEAVCADSPPTNVFVADYDGDGQQELRVNVSIDMFTDAGSRSGPGMPSGSMSISVFLTGELRTQGTASTSESWEDTEGGEPDRTEEAEVVFIASATEGRLDMVQRGLSWGAFCEADGPDDLSEQEVEMCDYQRIERVHRYDAAEDRWVRPTAR
ncbi:MAG: hypothetical protein H6726_32420 [Sandaracinaceae bacterium]|nr:hypothetical protein [Sandaracinaceae bacterium]